MVLLYEPCEGCGPCWMEMSPLTTPELRIGLCRCGHPTCGTPKPVPPEAPHRLRYKIQVDAVTARCWCGEWDILWTYGDLVRGRLLTRDLAVGEIKRAFREHDEGRRDLQRRARLKDASFYG